MNPPAATPRLDGLRYLKVQPIEPFQAIVVDTNAFDVLEDLDNVINGLRRGLNGGEEGRVVRKHAPW